MITIVLALLFSPQVPEIPLPQIPRPIPQFRVVASAYPVQFFLDRGEIPPVPLSHSRDETLIRRSLQTIGNMCKKSPPNSEYTCTCSVEALSTLEIAADLGETTFTRVVGLYAIALAAKQGCRDDSLARAVLKGLRSEPPVDLCVPNYIGDFAVGAISEVPRSISDDGLNVVEAAAWAAAYFGPPGPYDASAKEFKSALEDIAADTDQKRHATTINAAKDALSHLNQ